jgi:high-affinity iron transporter
LALVDYIGSDYRNAVQAGKIVNAEEYQEMTEFSARSLELFRELKNREHADKAGIENELRALASHIQRKSADDAVAESAQTIKERLIATYDIVTHPKALPDLESGKRVYAQNCAQCHGETGKGDGPGRDSMNPKNPPPADFHDTERMAGLSPFKAFNTASYGIEGTAMASFAALSERQRWDVAFYLFSLRFSAESAKAGAALLQRKAAPAELTSVSTLAGHSDEELLSRVKPYTETPAETHSALAYLRRGVLEQGTADPLWIARTRLREAAELYSRGEREPAYQKAVEAYLDGFELSEPALFAKNARLGRALEREFTEFRNALKRGAPAADVGRRFTHIDEQLDEAARVMAQEDAFTSYYAFVNSALIILREGLEAALIIAAILAALRVMGLEGVTRYIHAGWLLAIGAGVVTWIVAETALTLSGRHRETLEGFISIFAAAALFYVGYWLHTHAEVKKWRTFIDRKVKNVISARRIWGLVGISFFAVYREAFEVVLFYQALWLQNQANHAPVTWGFVAGSAALVVLALVIFKLGLRIPLKYFFGATGTLLYILAFVFAGHGINELQAAGWVPSTPVGFSPQLPVLGIYPTVETLAAQLVMIVAFVLTSLWMIRANGKPSVAGKNP